MAIMPMKVHPYDPDPELRPFYPASIVEQETGISSVPSTNFRNHCGSSSAKVKAGVPQTDTSGFDVNYLRLDIEASDTSTFVSGMAHYKATTTIIGLQNIILDLSHYLIVDSVFFKGKLTGYTQNNDLLIFSLDHPEAYGQPVDFDIYYHGASKTGGFFSGISSRKDTRWNIPVTWTLSEPFGARDWFPAKQVLTDKIDSADINITTPSGCLAGSNGILTAISTLPDGRKCHHWKSRYPIDYYLISLTVCNYQDYRIYAHSKGMTDSILIQNYIYNVPGVLSTYKAGIDRTPQMIILFSGLFGPYPFAREKYGHCLAPIGGGMEHQTMTTIAGFDFGLVSHELSHMWWGDDVTCASWQDIWLNEGFASYGEFLATDMLLGKESGLGWLRHAHDEAMTTPSGSVYVPFNQISDESRIFSDPLSYKKGASILHMLRYEINNDDLFFNILREYRKRFTNSTATGEDFRQVAENLTGRDFSWFFNQWYYGEGFPGFNVFWNQTGNKLVVSIEQSASSDATPLFLTSMDLQIFFRQGDTTMRIWIDDKLKRFEFNLTKAVAYIQIDPGNWLLKRANVLQLPAPEEFKLFPNPFTGELQIDFYSGEKERTFRLADLTGKILGQFISRNKNVHMDSLGLAKGIYILNIVEGDKSWQVRVIKE